MANFVIKKDGIKEPFDAEKIKHAVNMAATQAGLAPEEAVWTSHYDSALHNLLKLRLTCFSLEKLSP